MAVVRFAAMVGKIGGSIAVAVVMLGAGCGSAATPPSSGAARAKITARVARWEAQLDRLHSRIAGTPAELGAGDKVAFHIEQDPTARCMRSKGIDYPGVAFVDQWKYYPPHGAGAFDTRWLASVTDPTHLSDVLQAEAAARHGVHRDEAGSDVRYQDLGPAARKAWDKAIRSCPEGQNYEDAWHPQQYYRLLGPFHAMVDRVDLSLRGYAAGYRSCMTASGFAVRNHEQLLSSLERRLGSTADVPVPGHDGDATWRAWMALERRAGAADASCRSAAHAAGWARLGPKIAGFERRYARTLAEEQAGWRRLVHRAAARAETPGVDLYIEVRYISTHDQIDTADA